MKNVYYFSHDGNARNDEKILMLRAAHGWEGYGLFWALVEMMFETGETCLCHSKIKGIAVSYNVDKTLLETVIQTCIQEGLFISDGEKFWSESLRRRKETFQTARDKKARAGKRGMESRWGTAATEPHNNAITDHNNVITKDNSVITENNKVKESKVKESKRKESTKDIFTPPGEQHPPEGEQKNKKKSRLEKTHNQEPKVKYREYVHMSPSDYSKLQQKYGPAQTESMLDILDNYKGSRGRTYKDDYRAILSWVVKRYCEDQKKGVYHGQAGNYPGTNHHEGDGDLDEFIQHYDSFPDDDMH